MKIYRDKPEPRRDYFLQGFWLGIFSGVLGALVVLSNRRNEGS